MPTPAVYARGCREPFQHLDEALQTSKIEVLFATDRRREDDAQNGGYGYRRSRSLAFGSASILVGDGMDWPELLAYSTSEHRRSARPRISLSAVTEIGRLPETPHPFTWEGAEVVTIPETVAERAQVVALARREVLERLGRTPRKEIFLFIHGVNTSFETALLQGAEAWHFLGREGVPIIYTWPARRRALGLSYAYDRESGEFTIFHLKQLLKALAAIREVEKIHILAHSRGTDVATTALRELVLEARGGGPARVSELRIGKVALIAADLDFEVATQRLVAEALGPAVEGFTLYARESDISLAAARTLFNSRSRLGQLRPRRLYDGEIAIVENVANADIVMYDGPLGGPWGHFYFRESPAVSSDVLLWMRYGLAPGKANGRPLEPIQRNVWRLGEDYDKKLSVGGAPTCRR